MVRFIGVVRWAVDRLACDRGSVVYDSLGDPIAFYEICSVIHELVL